MSNETLAIVLETVSEMMKLGLSKSFIKKEVPIMFEQEFSHDLWQAIFEEV